MHRDFGPTQIEAALSHSPHKTHWKSKMYMAGLGTQSWKTDTLELRLLWGSWFPSLCAGHPGSAAITPECPSFHHCSKTWSHYSVDVKFCTRKLLLWSLGVFWLLLQEAVLYLCLSYVTGPGSRLVNIYATSNELFPITYSHKLYQQLTFFFFSLDFILKWKQKIYVQCRTEKVLCATVVQLLMSGIFFVNSCISLPGKIFSVSKQIKSALAVSVLFCR